MTETARTKDAEQKISHNEERNLLQRYIDSCSTWGRWGQDDQRGALNLVGPEEVTYAASLVRQGKAISLTLPYDQNGPQPGGFRANPQLFVTATGTDHITGAQDELPGGFGPARGFGFSDDVLVMPTQSGTQWDALSHIFWQGKMYNGHSADLVTSRGAVRNGIENCVERLVLPAVLVDAPRFLGRASLEPGEAISPALVDEYLRHHQIEPRPGTALVVRTGFMAARRSEWGDYAGGSAPGLSLHMAPWLRQHDIAAVATDTWGVEVRPNEIDCFQPLHVVSLVHGGIAFGEMFDLDALAADCDADGIYEFMLAAPPLPLTGASGAPVSAMALK